jgi:predicted ATPase
VAQICQQLDGLPLAIELLTTRLNLMTPEVLLSHMNSNFILITRGLRSLPSHQETLYQAIQRSYELLTPQEKRLFAFLSVFKGGFSLSQVEEAFLDNFDHDELSGLIDSLLDKSLLQIRPGLLAGPRISMLNTIKFFAAEQFADAVDKSTACERHLRVFLGLAKTADRKMHQQDQLTWISQIDMEQDNLKAALKYSLMEKDLDALITILTPLGWFWFLKGNYTELASW